MDTPRIRVWVELRTGDELDLVEVSQLIAEAIQNADEVIIRPYNVEREIAKDWDGVRGVAGLGDLIGYRKGDWVYAAEVKL